VSKQLFDIGDLVAWRREEKDYGIVLDRRFATITGTEDLFVRFFSSSSSEARWYDSKNFTLISRTTLAS
jgi:hypothetical protein